MGMILIDDLSFDLPSGLLPLDKEGNIHVKKNKHKAYVLCNNTKLVVELILCDDNSEVLSFNCESRYGDKCIHPSGKNKCNVFARSKE